MRALAIAIVTLVGCDGTAKPAGKTTPSTSTAPPARVTCQEVGIILASHTDAGSDMPAREHAIATACSEQRWSTEIVDCIGSNPNLDPCIAKLTPEQQAHYTTVAQISVSDDFQAPPPPSLPMQLACADAITDVASFAPAVAVPPGPDRDWAVAMRQTAVVAACNAGDGWAQATRLCLVATHDADGIGFCRAAFEPAQAQALVQTIADTDALVAKALVAKRKPAAIGCKQVTATYYGDAAWKDKLVDAKPADRKTAIASSRAAMTKACTDGAWPEHQRACIVAGGAGACFADDAWGFPSTGDAFQATGIPECDAYGTAVMKLSKCSKFPKDARTAVIDGFKDAAKNFRTMPADARQGALEGCKAALDAITQSINAVCP